MKKKQSELISAYCLLLRAAMSAPLVLKKMFSVPEIKFGTKQRF